MSQSDFVSRGQALVAAGQFQEAVKVCRLGLLGRPTTVEGRVVLGSALLALKRYDEVLAEMRVALELDHTAVAAHTLRAEAQIKKGDSAAALDTLAEAQQLAPNDPRVLQLLNETQQRLPPGKRATSAHPAADLIGAGDTRHYPQHEASEDPDASESFTKPTSLSSPAAPRRSSVQRQPVLHRDPTPPPSILAVGDKSGTVEVDPELEGVAVDDDLDFDDLAAPPPATPAPQPAAKKQISVPRPGPRSAAAPAQSRMTRQGVAAQMIDKPGERPARSSAGGDAQMIDKPGERRSSAGSGAGGDAQMFDKRTPTMDLVPDDDSDVLEVDETSARVARVQSNSKPSPTAVRKAVSMPSGPIDIGPTAPPPQPLPPAPIAPRPGNPIVAAMPTVAAMHPPQAPYQQPSGLAPPQSAFAKTLVPPSLGGQPIPASNRPTMIAQAQQPPPGIFPPAHNAAPPPNWGQADPRSLAAANEPTAQPHIPPIQQQQQVQMEPGLQAMLAGMPVEHPSAASMEAPRTGMRKARSKLQITMWILIGVVVIGGGVFAGFQIRAMRLRKQVAAARANAMDLTKNDTYANWTAARDELSRIVHASGTNDNQAALARARALIAYEFDDAFDDAKVTVDALADKSSFDANIAAAYLALAASDGKTAKLAADAALSEAQTDPAANYVAGQVALLASDLPEAIKRGKAAVDKDPRPLYSVGLARIQAAATNWSEARASLDRAFSVMADQPSAVIERGFVLASSGLVPVEPKLTTETRAQLAKLVGDAKKSGLSQAQLAFGNLALAQLDFARNDPNAARADIAAAGAVGIEDQRFAEVVVETLTQLGQFSHAQNLAKKWLGQWPTSARLRLALTRDLLAQGNSNDALATLKDLLDLGKSPVALAVRGEAKLATGDVEGARADYEVAQKAAPKLEAVLVGRAWVELAAGDADAAKKALGDLAGDKVGASPAVVAVNAAILRRDPTTRDKAKTMLEAIVNGPPGLETARAELELARIDHDVGDFAAARKAYAVASASGSFDARLESGMLLIEDRDPNGGRDTLDALLKEAGDKAPAQLVLETARARMLAGDHAGAAALLATADKLPSVQKWKLQRELGRLHLRRNDIKAAINDLGSALEGCGSDGETFLLAADAATSDEKSGLTDKIKTLAPQRLRGLAEAQIVNGKLLLATGKVAEAEAAYKAAREQLQSERAAPRRVAQANYGLAVVAYQKEKDADALASLALVLQDDPSIYDAYLFEADLDKNKTRAFEVAKVAVKYNADYPRAWHVLGKLAAKNNDKATLADATEKLKALAPNSDELKELESLKK